VENVANKFTKKEREEREERERRERREKREGERENILYKSATENSRTEMENRTDPPTLVNLGPYRSAK
jgi:hypothetical protein